MLSSRANKFNKIDWIGIILIKLVLLGLFSSAYQTELFKPFVNSFLDSYSNPWKINIERKDMFPYPSVMLLILSLFELINKILGNSTVFLNTFISKLPLFISDVLIFFMLSNLLKAKRLNIVLWFFFSPIILFSTYLHSQLDIIPVFFLVASLFQLQKNNYTQSAIFLGLAIACKTTALAALPLIAIYLYKNKGFKTSVFFVLISLVTFIFFQLPYLSSKAFQIMVFSNPKQQSIYDALFGIGKVHVYLLLMAALSIYARFAVYKKTNFDLLMSFLGALFAVFVSLVEPSPGWFVWIVPFIVWFYSKIENIKLAHILFGGLSIAYLVFFVFFHQSEYEVLLYLNKSVGLPIVKYLNKATNLSFTFLEFTVVANVFLLYRYGIKSNTVYKKDNPILIGIGGDSGAGKSTLLGDLKNLLQTKILEIEGDGDHKWERGNENWKTITHLDPKGNFLHRQADNLLKLKRNEPIERTEYNHNTGTFTTPKKIFPKEFIVLSGLHPFYLPKMRKIIDLKIYLEPDENLRRYWKIRRDTQKRGYSVDKIIDQIEQRMPDAEKYIYPQKQFAEIIIQHFCDFNPLDVIDEGSLKDEDIKVKISLSASISLEELIEKLQLLKVNYLWDYEDNLQNQYIMVYDFLSAEDYENMATEIIPNVGELVDNPIWNSGNRGLVQLICLMYISEKLTNPEQE